MDQPAGGGRLDSLTSLRALAATSVFFFHGQDVLAASADPPTGPAESVWAHLTAQGNVGVSFFFILSGFVLTWSHRPGDGARPFLSRRFARVYPNHLVTWAVAAGLMTFGLTPWSPLRSALANLVLVNTFVGGGVWLVMNAPSWSLEVEQFFYLLFPTLHPRLSRVRAAWRLRLVALIVAVSTAVAVAVVVTGQNSERVTLTFEFFPPFRLPEFVIGMLLGLAAQRPGLPRVPTSAAWALTVAGYVGAGFAPELLRNNTVMLVPFVLLIVAVAGADLDGRRGWLTRPHIVRLGAISYAFYCVHHLFIVVAEYTVTGRSLTFPTFLAIDASLLFVSWVAAWLLHRWIEVPADRWLRRRLLA